MGLEPTSPLSIQMSQQIVQRHKLTGRIDGRTSKFTVNVE
jgi:hypothetical protein